MKLLLLIALGTCLWAVWPLRREVAGLLPYLCAQTAWAATAIAALIWVKDDSREYLAIHSAFSVFALGCALWMAGAMLSRYDAPALFLALAVAGPAAFAAPMFMGAHLSKAYGSLPVPMAAQMMLWSAGVLLFCGLTCLVTLAPPTLPPFATGVRIILGALWIALAAWKLSLAMGVVGRNRDWWREANTGVPMAIEFVAFALLAWFALHAERGPIGTVAPQAELAEAQQAAGVWRKP